LEQWYIPATAAERGASYDDHLSPEAEQAEEANHHGEEAAVDEPMPQGGADPAGPAQPAPPSRASHLRVDFLSAAVAKSEHDLA